jgi:hypothetical protein
MLKLFRRFCHATGYSLSAEALCRDESGRPILDCDDEWWLEVDGERIALLTDRRREEMFWSSFLLLPAKDDPVQLQQLGDKEFWLQLARENCTFRSRSHGLVATFAFPARDPPRVPGRVLMRRL